MSSESVPHKIMITTCFACLLLHAKLKTNPMGGVAVILIIDGYNVMKQVGGYKTSSRHEVKVFVDEVAAYLHRRKFEAVIAFDGGQTPYQDVTRKPFGEVVFSGYKDNADEVIKRYLMLYKGHEVLLISSDRALRDYAHGLGFESLGGYEFYHDYVRLAERTGQGLSQTEVQKLATDTTPEIDALMMEAAAMVPAKEENLDLLYVHKNKTKTLARKERKRLKFLDKL